MTNPLGLTPEDLGDAYEGTLDPSRTAWYNALIDKAVRRLFGKCPGLQERMASASEDSRATVADVVLDAVMRVIRNPDPTYESEGEGNYNYKLNKLVASGNLWFPKEDLEVIGCGGGTMVPRTVRVTATQGWGFP